jgi:hypothetical protein
LNPEFNHVAFRKLPAKKENRAPFSGKRGLPFLRWPPVTQYMREIQLRYAKPDPERRRLLIAAPSSFLETHRYRAVIESLSIGESLIFSAIQAK